MQQMWSHKESGREKGAIMSARRKRNKRRTLLLSHPFHCFYKVICR